MIITFAGIEKSTYGLIQRVPPREIIVAHLRESFQPYLISDRETKSYKYFLIPYLPFYCSASGGQMRFNSSPVGVPKVRLQ
jgi:hypothetical protein